MMAFLAGLLGLFLLSALLWWWARGGVIPAIMLSAPVAAFLPVLAVSLHDGRDATNLAYAPAVMLALLAVAWGPRLWRRRRAVRPPEPAASSCKLELAERPAFNSPPPPVQPRLYSASLPTTPLARFSFERYVLVAAACAIIAVCF